MSSRNRFTLIAATAAAAVVLSACSPTAPAEPKPWPNEGQLAAAPTNAAVTDNWISLPGVAVPPAERDISLLHPRFSATAAPGVGVWEQGTTKVCTLGPVVAPERNRDDRGYLTAKHCDQPGTAQAIIYADAAHTDPRPLGVYTPRKSGSLDATSIWLASDAAAPATIAGHPVAGVLTDTALKELASGRAPAPKVCVYGAVSGLACGDLIDADDRELTVDIPTREGDSGAAVFLYDEGTRAVTLIGLVSSGNDSFTYATYLDEALRELGAKLVTDPAVSIASATDPRYSDQAVTAS
ncbi:trypsin domain-containing protein [Mycobacteroides abscessus subsp. abscessus]|uniref:hypothetical protein n=1 Tax=Mycobacteroides abscessus TaxID=36809 RepID=UPI0005DD4A18|nr:hypothetical protein [Mycobacteroides abscessus]ANO17376.1 hypothetical protein BAB78_01225 [Mycobacteroides abscessus]MDB2220984.1 hypothetical protein [Mycobacteroides abscessus subsp. abscessus]OTR08827.1 hypothetical protein B9M85_01180 [Mycobacteroides abscessus]CPR89819.1 trypsin domain-containing protein [Mycobacteroides abscessus]SHS87277.1 trypsin domain-containing protein [Mycobacteroides abscessus subsp. abscessus]